MKRYRKLAFLVVLALLFSMTAIFPVQAKASTITMNYKNLNMQVGEKVDLNVSGKSLVKSSQKVTWTSSDRKIATVDKKGIVTAKKKGTVTITAKTAGKKEKASCRVTVRKKEKYNTKVLVAYFSATNTTKGVAKKIANVTGADLYRITPAKVYSAKDLNYDNDNSRATKEQGNKKIRPQLKGKSAGIKNYDIIFLGYPIWWGDAPRIISTFLESYDFSGKTIIPFCTSGSSGISESVKTLRALTAKKAKWLTGKRFEGSVSKNTISNWVDGLKLGIKQEKPEEPTEQPTQQPTQQPTENPTDTPSGRKALVAYFSCTNKTKGIAESVAEITGADIYRITPEVPYTDADLNYGDNNSRTSIEQNDSASRPAISGTADHMQDYEVIYLGYPIWWSQAPRIISTFLESYDFSGKTIIPFCTSGSSGIGSSATNLHPLVSDSAVWKDGRRFGSGTAKDEVAAWINGLGL